MARPVHACAVFNARPVVSRRTCRALPHPPAPPTQSQGGVASFCATTSARCKHAVQAATQRLLPLSTTSPAQQLMPAAALPRPPLAALRDSRRPSPARSRAAAAARQHRLGRAPARRERAVERGAVAVVAAHKQAAAQRDRPAQVGGRRLRARTRRAVGRAPRGCGRAGNVPAAAARRRAAVQVACKRGPPTPAVVGAGEGSTNRCPTGHTAQARAPKKWARQARPAELARPGASALQARLLQPRRRALG
jgi:hypothetical protein